MQLKILEACVDEILVFGVEAAAMYADHVVCAPASKSYFHYILNSCIRNDWEGQGQSLTLEMTNKHALTLTLQFTNLNPIFLFNHVMHFHQFMYIIVHDLRWQAKFLQPFHA